MLKYALYRNHLTKAENDYSAIPQSLINKKIEDIIHQITKSGSILKQTECVAVIHDFFRAISENLHEGYGFVSEYIRIQPKIVGVFEGNKDQFDALRHQKQLSVTAANVLKKAVAGVKLEKVVANIRKPEVKSVYDHKSQERDSQLSPGHMLEVIGSRLKLEKEQSDEGIFLVNSAEASEIKIQQIHTNLPSKISGMIPEGITAGSYILEVRNRPGNKKNLSIGIFTTELSVN